MNWGGGEELGIGLVEIDDDRIVDRRDVCQIMFHVNATSLARPA